MSTRSRTLGRVLVATGAALAIGSIGILGAGAAQADTGSDDPSLTEKVVAVNSGTIVVRLPGEEYANATVVVLAPLPGTDDVRAVSAPVEPEADEDGYVAELENLAGPVYIQIDNGSSVGDDEALSALASPSPDPFPDTDAAIYRHATAVYDLDPETGEYILEGDAPTSPAPDSADLQYLIPAATSTFTPTTYETGKAFTVKFRDIISTYDGHRVGEEEPRPVDFYGYSAPTLLLSTSIVGGVIDFAVPVAFTTGEHEIVALDEFGRLNLYVGLDGGAAAPVVPGTDTRPALAKTGAGDQTGALALGAGVLALGAAAVAGGLVLRRRDA